MTSKVGKRPLRSLSAHEKMEAIRRVHDGESKASVARDIGVPESTLRGWCKNEDKILYLSRQSTPDTDDSADHPREKKPRYDDLTAALQPYNLSVRGASNSPPPVISQPELTAEAPGAAATAVTSTATIDTDIAASALNLSKPEISKTVLPPTSLSADRERERNRAELARLSVELGLNRPEMFVPNTNIAANLSDLSTLTANLGLVAQWNSALLQQVTANTLNTKKRSSSSLETTSQVQAPVVTTSSIPTSTSTAPLNSHHHNHHHNNNNINKSHKVKKVDTSVDDSTWYWLKTQQAMLGLCQNQQNNVDPNSSWFWKWYKQLAYSQQYPQQQQQQQQQQQINPTTPEKPILYQQLTKDNSENQKNDETPKSTKTNTKIRAVLDNLLLNNNNNEHESSVNNGLVEVKEEKFEDASPISVTEALNHGDTFLKWLEKCSDPSVTAVQILQFRYLLNNIRAGVDRKNGAENIKTKVRSRK